MDIVTNFPTVCFEYPLLQIRLSQYSGLEQQGWITPCSPSGSSGSSSALTRAHCSQLAALLGCLGLSLQMIFHITFPPQFQVVRSANPIAQASIELLLESDWLMLCWLKQETWPRPESLWERIPQGKTSGRHDSLGVII